MAKNCFIVDVKVRTKPFVNARMLNTLTSFFKYLEIFLFSIFVFLFLLFKIHAYFIDQTLQLKD